MNNSKIFQGIIIGGKISNTKAIIIALLKAGPNVPTIITPDEYTYTLKDVFDTSYTSKKIKKRGINYEQTNFKNY